MTLEDRFNKLVQLNANNFRLVQQELSTAKGRIAQLEQKVQALEARPAPQLSEAPPQVRPPVVGKHGMPVSIAPTDEMREALFYSSDEDD